MNQQRPVHERRYVRVRNTHDGFVEFDFAIGDPQLYVELILTEGAFEEFCEANQVQILNEEEAEQIDRYRDTWVRPAGDGKDSK
jgi:phenol hydroxylase P0 protein